MNKERLHFLFAQYVGNRISISELAELQEHLGRTSDDQYLHELVGEELQQALEEPDSGAIGNDGWLDGLEDRVLEKISNNPVPQRTRRMFPWRRAIAVAASAIMVLMAGTWVVSEFSNKNEQPSQFSDITPGFNRASLTLANGRKIDLSTDQKGIVVGNQDITYQDGTTEIVDLRPGSASMLVLSTPRGGQYQLTLSDGTRVWLNAESTLKYPSRFTGDRREVEIDGEGYFSVATDYEKPFIVLSQGQEVEVLGTEFNVSAYSDEPYTRTTLVEGKVQVVNKLSKIVNRLLPGQQSLLRGSETDIRQVDVRDYVAWKEGLIVLNQADLPAIARQIERWYDVEFVLPTLPPTEPVFGELNRDVNLSELLHSLHLHYGLDFKIEGRKIMASN